MSNARIVNGIDLDHELSRGAAARIIRHKARRLVGHGRLRSSDQDDIRQHLSLAVFLAADKFDPQEGDWAAFVSTVVERKAIKLLKRRKAIKREHRHHVTSLSSLVEDEDRQPVPLATQIGDPHRESLTGQYRSSDHELVEIADGVPVAWERLTEEQRQLCREVSEQTLTEVARDQDVPRRTLRSRMEKVVEVFVEEGF